MYAHDGTKSVYIEVPNDSLSSFEHGRGYWLVTRKAHRLDTGPVLGLSTPTDSAFAVTLEPGWNLIGQPFAFSVAWDSMTVNGQSMIDVEATVVEPAVAWSGEQYQYSVDTFRPWRGYWVKNLTDSAAVLRIPPRAAQEAAPSASEPLVAAVPPEQRGSEDAWTISISASSMGALDTYNYVGVRRTASSGRDGHDRSDAPMSPGNALSLHFPHPTWEGWAGSYTVDIRGAYEQKDGVALMLSSDADIWGHVWCFDVAKNFSIEGAGDEVVLEFAGIKNVPLEAEILLVDRVLECVTDLRKITRYVYFQEQREIVASEDDARFVLLIGSEDFLDMNENELPGLPAKAALFQNYPNPFNPSTIIRYELTNPGRVQLRVYDVKGALVRVLEDRNRPAGRYEVGWDGENESGARVASGIYFYRLTAPGFSQTRKMVLVE
jgi:hypothetical protein